MTAPKYDQLANCAAWNDQEAERCRKSREVKRAERLEAQATRIWQQSEDAIIDAWEKR